MSSFWVRKTRTERNNQDKRGRFSTHNLTITSDRFFHSFHYMQECLKRWVVLNHANGMFQPFMAAKSQEPNTDKGNSPNKA